MPDGMVFRNKGPSETPGQADMCTNVYMDISLNREPNIYPIICKYTGTQRGEYRGHPESRHYSETNYHV